MLLKRFRQWQQARRVRQITIEQARQRAARGAAYLDDVDPGWHERVNPATLELGDGQCCVLGQLHGGFRQGLGRSAILQLGSAPQASLSPVRLGFQCVQDVPEAWQDRDYAHLNAAWQHEIARRRPVDIAPPVPLRATPAPRVLEAV